eukprot:Nitzschia sp. Nitz4//scaffold54_size114964//32677//34122//NITZ4_003842-RA/size114964-augustus-gene-0.2-mRNA-1//1//CDS//3329554324//3827//frame0
MVRIEAWGLCLLSLVMCHVVCVSGFVGGISTTLPFLHRSLSSDFQASRHVTRRCRGGTLFDSSVSQGGWADVKFERKLNYHTPKRPQNDLMIRVALGEDVTRTPVWLFRQAGRHLPEYRAYKNETGFTFIDMLSRPECVAECTLQPLRRYDLDAAILFSDILVVAEALGIEVTMPGGVGIQVPKPLVKPTEVKDRIPALDDISPEFVQEKLGHVLEAVRLIRNKMAEEGKDIPLIGFSAAPWTLLFYMVGGSSKKNQEIGEQWLNDHPVESKELLRVLTKLVVEYMSAQIENGAHIIQVFEAMGMMISGENFSKFAIPCLQTIAAEIKSRFPAVPLMVFARGACYANDSLSAMDFDVITIDGSVDRTTAREIGDSTTVLQGNYDPRELISGDGTKTKDTVRQSVRLMLGELGPKKLIANLGEGLSGRENPTLVNEFVEAVHDESTLLIARVNKKND